MKIQRSAALLMLLLWAGLLRGQSPTFNQSQWELIMHPGIRHVGVDVEVKVSGNAYHGALSVSSDSSWLLPSWDSGAGSIQLQFNHTNLIATQTATVRAKTATGTNEFFVHGNVRNPTIVSMAADPVRSRIYAVHSVGTEAGSLIALDAIAGRPLFSQTLGHKPTDIAVDANSDELLVIHSADRSIAVLDPQTLGIKETLALQDYGDWGVDSTSADIAIGPGHVVYYTDGSWAPGLHVYDRSTHQVLQSLGIDGNGFGDLGLSSDRKTLIGWAQFGWSAGWAGSYATRFTVESDGKLTQRESSPNQWPTPMVREPFDAPVLFSSDDQRAFIKQFVFSSDNVATPTGSLPDTVYAISPGGEVACTSQGVYDTFTGNKLVTLTGNPTRMVITPDYARLVYFDPSAGAFKFLDLIAAVGGQILGLNLFPADGSIALSPETLKWSPVPGVSRYQVYFGRDREVVAAATTNSVESVGSTTAPQFKTPGPLENGLTYYWRVDAVTTSGVVPGDIHSFTVSEIAVSVSKLQGSTVAGFRSVVSSFDVSSKSPGVAWKAEGGQPWISFTTNSGVTPARVEVVVDASQLPVGTSVGEVLVGTGPGGMARLPLRVRVEALSLTLLKSDPESEMAYGISEDASNASAHAYLLEIDTKTERVTRTVEVGNSVTDLAIHNRDGRIYVPNWRTGSLLAVDLATFQVVRTYPFAPFGGVGYGGGDVYRVSPGAAGRLVVEEADQWIHVNLFDTVNGRLIQGPFVREGGGGTDPTGRYYYHGENNSSGATIQKYDLAGDVFTLKASIRVESASYYGSRVVTVSADGSRVFWNGSAFDENLKEQWTFADHIYSCTTDGRYAFGQDKIYDIDRRSVQFVMPVTTTISAYNIQTEKLVIQQAGRLRHYRFNSTAPELIAPRLSAKSIAAMEVKLEWTDESLETGFTVQKRSAGGDWSDEGNLSQNTTQFTMGGLQPETAYEFRVKATATTAASAWSEVLSVTTPGLPPSQPLVFQTSFTSRFVRLGWFDVTKETGIRVDRRLGEDFTWTSVLLPADTVSYTDSTVVPGQTYTYRIVASNSWASVSSADIGPFVVPLPAPPTTPLFTSIRLLPGLQVRMTLNSNEDTDGFEIERQTTEAGIWTRIADLPSTTLEYLDTNVVAHVEYQYRVIAKNGVGKSQPSIPQVIRVDPIGCILSDDFSLGSTLSMWSQVSGGQIVDGIKGLKDGGALWFGGAQTRVATTLAVAVQANTYLEFDLRAGNRLDGVDRWDPSEGGKGILVEYTKDSVTWLPVQTLNTQLPEFLSWQHFSIALPGAALGSQTQFRWRQVRHNGIGNDQWALDNVCILGPVPEPPPATPFLLAAPASSSAVNLLWTAVPQATAYRVERSLGVGGWIEVASTGQDQTWYSDTTCLPGRTYSFRVRAANAGGVSAPSPVSFATTMDQMDEWQAANWGIEGESMEGAGADGMSYLERYAFNLTATEPARWYQAGSSTGGLPLILPNPVDGSFVVEFARRKASMTPGIVYAVETSSDLIHWTVSTNSESVTEIDRLWESARHVVSGNTGAIRFCRVVVRKL